MGKKGATQFNAPARSPGANATGLPIYGSTETGEEGAEVRSHKEAVHGSRARRANPPLSNCATSGLRFNEPGWRLYRCACQRQRLQMSNRGPGGGNGGDLQRPRCYL
jgi:hypothetical protein